MGQTPELSATSPQCQAQSHPAQEGELFRLVERIWVKAPACLLLPILHADITCGGSLEGCVGASVEASEQRLSPEHVSGGLEAVAFLL